MFSSWLTRIKHMAVSVKKRLMQLCSGWPMSKPAGAAWRIACRSKIKHIGRR